MHKKYQDSIREEFENHIAKQLRLEAVPKDVLAVQVFAMNANLEYVDKKLQTKWGEWEAACSQQIEKDAVICESTGNVTGHGEFYAKRIRDQGKA